jgi:predicted enzyme related to lactoylglutathione lyase
MPEMQHYATGVPCWVDATSPDLDATIAFYGGLFGWTAERDPRPEAGGYTMLSLDGKYVAAASPPMPQQEGTPPAWTTYIAADDVDATAARVTQAGGIVFMEPFDVFDSGRMTVAQDPTGAVFGIWQANQHHGAQVTREPGSLAWNECRTADAETAAAFYERVFGHTVTEADMGGTLYRVLEVDGQSVAGVSEMEQGPPHWLTTFTVTDADASCAKAEEVGGRVLAQPFDIPTVGRYAELQDPVGAVFGVLQDPPAA